MELEITDKYCIIKPLSTKLTSRETKRITDEIQNLNIPVAIDMSSVDDCTFEFIELCNKIKNISIFNINSDIFALFLSMNLDKTLKLFVSELDFAEKKHQLINRKFCVV